MLTYIVAAVALGLIFYFVVLKNGKLNFWNEVAKNPNHFFELIKKDPAWVVDDGSVLFNKKEYSGPFRLYVPSEGRVVVVWARFESIEESQKNLLQKINLLNQIDNDV